MGEESPVRISNRKAERRSEGSNKSRDYFHRLEQSQDASYEFKYGVENSQIILFGFCQRKG